MSHTTENEQRDCVRAELCADVRFSVIEPDVYEALKTGGALPKGRSESFLGVGAPLKEEERQASAGVDPHLIDFLIQIEDKLDRVLDLLEKNQQQDRKILLGRGLDIGGGGMRILSDQEVASGNILETTFRVSRYPAVALTVYGRVTRVTEAEMNGGKGFEIALEFIDLKESDKESIFSYVFQVQRETIRKQRNQ